MFIICLILMLLNCFLNLQANDNCMIPFTGEQINADTIVNVPIKTIRIVNDKLTERKYLLKINSTQDSIITLNAKYILEQDTIINDLKNRIIENNKVTEKLKKQYEKEHKRKTVVGGVAVGLGVALGATVLVAILVK